MKRLLLVGFVAASGVGLSGCLFSQIHLSNDFGQAARTDIMAQIADPEPRYAGPPPASNGVRAALAQGRYITGTTIQPAGSASDIGLDTGAPPPPPPPPPAMSP